MLCLALCIASLLCVRQIEMSPSLPDRGSPARSVLLSGVIPVILKNDLLPRGGVPPYAPSTQALNGSGPRTTGIMRLVGRVRAGVGNQRGHTSPASASSAYGTVARLGVRRRSGI